MKYKLILIIPVLFSFYTSFSQNDTAAERLNNYRDKIFSIYNKCSLKDGEIAKAIQNKNAADIESGRILLLQFANAGIKELTTIESFNGDPALKFNCREILLFYKDMAESDLPQVRDYFIEEENFSKIKTLFKEKPVKKYSRKEIDAYNTEVKKYNDAEIRYTLLNNFITTNRKVALYNWTSSVKIFMDTHAAKK